MKKFLAIATLAAAMSGTAHAAVILGLYNTGVQAGGAGWAAGAGQKPGNGADLHWDLTGSPQAFTGNPIHGSWLSNASSTASRWITPNPNGTTSLDPSSDGIYRYYTTFDLTGFNPASASFAGRFAVDNRVDSILLNGAAITGSGGSFNIWQNFSASSGFLSGVNTLEFVVRNTAQSSGNPTGLRVEFLSSNVNAVPEPATWGMMIVGFGLAGSAMRYRRRKVAVSFG